ncbi:MAG TPA: hypothetical protein VGO30_04680 [Mycobacterium sp.]|nr:hypothetical protein [Mycobacterium sp.]
MRSPARTAALTLGAMAQWIAWRLPAVAGSKRHADPSSNDFAFRHGRPLREELTSPCRRGATRPYLASLSQNANVELRTIAKRFVDRAASATVLTGDDGDRFDDILHNVHLSEPAAHGASEGLRCVNHEG